jgi:hypothetical protein
MTPQENLDRVAQSLVEPKTPLDEKAHNALQFAIRELYDRFWPFYKLAQETGLPGYSLVRIVGGARVAGESYVEEYFYPILRALGRENHIPFRTLLVIRRMQDWRNNVDPNAKLPGGVEDPVAAEAALLAQMGQDRFDKLSIAADTWCERVREYELKPVLKSGRISQQAYDTLVTRWPHYIPFYRQGFDNEYDWISGTGSAASIASNFIKMVREEGSERALKDPLVASIAQVIKAHVDIFRNEAAKGVARMLIQQRLNTGNRELFQIKFAKTPVETATQGTISYWQRGRKVVAIVPKLFADVAKGLEREQLNLLSRAFITMTQPIRAGAITYNPARLPVNTIMDMMSAWFREGLVPFSPTYVRAWKAALQHNGDWHAVARAGALMSGPTGLARHTEEIGKHISPNKPWAIDLKNWSDVALVLPRILRMIPRTLAFLNEASEESTRIAVWLKAKRQFPGLDDATVALRVRDATVDFWMGGNVVRLLNQAIPFTTSGVTGTVGTFRKFHSDPWGSILRTVPLWLLCGLVYLWNKRFESYSMIPAYEKQLYWPVMIGEGTQNVDPAHPDQAPAKFPIYLRIPKGPMGVVLTSPFEVGLQLADNANNLSWTETLGQGAWQLARSMSPIEPEIFSLIPPGIGTAAQMAINKDFFRQRDIVPQGELARPTSQQYDQTNSKTAILLGEKFNVSPRMIDFMIQDMAGGGGQSAMWLSDLVLGAVGYNPVPPGEAKERALTTTETLKQNPIVGRFLGIRNTEPQRQAYATLDKTVTGVRQKLWENSEVRRFGIGINPIGDTITLNGQPLTLTPQQRAQIMQDSADLQKLALDDLTSREFYKAMNDADKRKALDLVRQKVTDNVRQGTALPQAGQKAKKVWTEREIRMLVDAMEQRAEYNAMPDYVGLTDEQVAQAKAVSSRISELIRSGFATNVAKATAMREDSAGYRYYLRLGNAKNRQKAQYLKSHPLISAFFLGGDLETMGLAA